jgi:hypothetical protein
VLKHIGDLIHSEIAKKGTSVFWLEISQHIGLVRDPQLLEFR